MQLRMSSIRPSNIKKKLIFFLIWGQNNFYLIESLRLDAYLVETNYSDGVLLSHHHAVRFHSKSKTLENAIEYYRFTHLNCLCV